MEIEVVSRTKRIFRRAVLAQAINCYSDEFLMITMQLSFCCPDPSTPGQGG